MTAPKARGRPAKNKKPSIIPTPKKRDNNNGEEDEDAKDIHDDDEDIHDEEDDNESLGKHVRPFAFPAAKFAACSRDMWPMWKWRSTFIVGSSDSDISALH